MGTKLESNQVDVVSSALANFNEMLSDPRTMALILGPITILALLATFFTIWVMVRRRKEQAAYKEIIAEADRQVAATSPEATDIITPEPSAAAETTETKEGSTSLQAEKDSPPAVASTEPPSEGPEAKVFEHSEQQSPVAAEPQALVEPEPATSQVPEMVAEVQQVDRTSWLARLNVGLTKTRQSLVGNLASLFGGGKKIDDEVLESVHEALFRADVGVATADQLVEGLKRRINSSESMDWPAVQSLLKEEVVEVLSSQKVGVNRPQSGPMVILVVGVNGVGKTTTIAKLAATHLAEDQKVLLCAADTYRAAAIDQLRVWGDRLGVEVIAHKQGSDPAAVAFDGVKAAKARDVDLLFIDTAGRLHNKKELMEELGKINRVIGRELPEAPHETWLVIDATTGQNALMQVKAFKEVVKLSGLVVTKLDGTAKGGVVIGASAQYELPVRYVGVGEKASDLRGFTAEDFASQLFH